MEEKFYEMMGVRRFEKIVITLYHRNNAKYPERQRLGTNTTTLESYKSENLIYLRNHFVRNQWIWFIGMFLGITNFVSGFAMFRIFYPQCIAGFLFFVICAYPAMLQRYNIVRINKILDWRERRKLCK